MPHTDMNTERMLQLQHLIGNRAVVARMRAGTLGIGRLQRADAGAAPSAEPAAPAAADAGAPAPESYPDIEALDLNATAKAAAIELKKKHPEIVFTSGRRDFAEQAHAMASNIVSSKNRQWVHDTYVQSTARDKVQKWIDDNATATTVDALTTGIQTTLDAMTDSDKAHISKHPAGAAFDVQPQEKDAAAIKADMQGLSGATKFLEEEGGLVRWHVQF